MQLVERQRVARLARREVVFLVAIVERLPAILDVSVVHVARERILRVVAHEALKISAIPIGCGALEHRGDFIGRIAQRNFWRGTGGQRSENHVRRTTHEFVSFNEPRERLGETLPRMSVRDRLAAALLRGLFLLRRFLLCLRPGLLGRFLFLLGLRLGGRARPRGPRGLLHRLRRRRRGGSGGRREHRLHEARSRPTTLRYVRLLKHRIFSMLVGARASWVAYSLPRDFYLAR